MLDLDPDAFLVTEHETAEHGLAVLRPFFEGVAERLALPARPHWKALAHTLDAFGVATVGRFVVSLTSGEAERVVRGGLLAVVAAPTILGGPKVLDVLAVVADGPGAGAALIRWARKTAVRLDLPAVVWHVPAGTPFDAALRVRSTDVLETAYLDRI